VWVDKPAPAAAPAVMDAPLAGAAVVPALPAEAAQALLEVAQLGYYRGVMNLLQSLQTRYPASTTFLQQQEVLARQYQFETMSDQLQKVLDACSADEPR
jgi:hypothetical protein